MNKVKKEEVLRLLNAEIVKIRASAQKTDEASKQRLSGWSAAGDKYHAMMASDLTNSYLTRLELLKKELDEASDNIPTSTEPPCMIRIQYQDGSLTDLYLVKNAVSLPTVSFISVDSPLGKAILGKRKDESLSYDLENGNKYSGKIVMLE